MREPSAFANLLLFSLYIVLETVQSTLYVRRQISFIIPRVVSCFASTLIRRATKSHVVGFILPARNSKRANACNLCYLYRLLFLPVPRLCEFLSRAAQSV